MPLWNKDEYRAKLERKLCVARETPEPVFDLADCNLHEVPDGVFSMCRVFRKEVLLLQNNHLHSLHSGSSLKDLSMLKVLNLSSNKIYSLPECIQDLSNLEVLNLENNCLKKLPSTFSCLKKLQSLNLKDNKLHEFPTVICKLHSLKALNVCGNKRLKELPKELSNLMCLSNLELDVPTITYPPADVTSEGTECILRFLCEVSGKAYVPASEQVQMPHCPEHVPEASSSTQASWDDSAMLETYQQYARSKEQRQKELLNMEKLMKETDNLQAQLAADAFTKRQKLLEDVTQEQIRLEGEIAQLQNKKEKEKQKLLNILSDIEEHSGKLIHQLMCLSEKNKKVETILDSLERDRIETEEMFAIKQEELEELRKNEILDSMKYMLEAEERQRMYEAEKLETTRRRHDSVNEADTKLSDLLSGRALDQQILLKGLLEEERFQKEAFEKLQLQRDKRHQEIAYQIKLIEEELSKLTLAEIKKQDLKADFELNVLAERRTALAILLTDLLEAREEREKELKQRLKEMEERHMNEMKDFWLLQYQKLMDKRPPEVLDAELNMDPKVKQILLEAGATHFVPLFAIKSVTLKRLVWMSLSDLKKLGVLDNAICESIIAKCQEYLESEKIAHSVQKEREMEMIPPVHPAPSAPPPEEDYVFVQPSAPPLSPESEVRLFCQAECVICLDKQSTTVFIPCGHVCCCWSCSHSLVSCPMCRNEVSTKFTLSVP